MTDRQLKGEIEAILFTMGDAVPAEQMARALQEDKRKIISIAESMMQEYETEDRGIRIIRLNDSFQLCTKKEHYDTLIRIARTPRKINLSDVLMETLSIIAYKQPVTKMEIEKIRGVKSDHAVNKLVEYGIVAELGRLDAPGRPIVFGTTEEFLRHFGISGVEELPQVDPEKAENFKTEAEREADVELRV